MPEEVDIRNRSVSSRRLPRGVAAASALAWLLAGGPLVADEIYVSVDADGVTSFSDIPVPGSERVELDVAPPPAGGAAAAREQIALQLEVAKALEESRLAREKAETERLEALAAARPQTYYYPVDRPVYVGGYYGGYWRPGFGWRPDNGWRPGAGGPPARPGRPPERPGTPNFRPVHPVVPPRPEPQVPGDHRGPRRESRPFGGG